MFDFEMKPLRSLILAMFLIVVFATLFNTVSTLIFTPVNTVTGVVRQTLDPQAIIYNYEWFKRQYQEITSFKTKITNTNQQITFFENSLKELSRKDWSFEQNQRYNELNAQKLGLENQCADMVKEFNARSSMANRNLVKFEDVPDVLNVSDYCEGEKTNEIF